MPYLVKKVVAEVQRRGVTVTNGGKHAKLNFAGAGRPFTISYGSRELNDSYVKALCKWGKWDFDEFIESL